MRTWTADGTLRAVLTGHQGGVNGVAISRDGTWLATAGDDQTVRTWAAAGTSRSVQTGHQDGVVAVAISPDGTWLATGEIDGAARTWTADGTSRAATVIRVDGEVSGCVWVLASTGLCIAGQRGLYRFSLQAPPS